MVKLIIFCLLFFISFQNVNKVQLKLETQKVMQSKKIIQKSEIFYNYKEGTLIIHYTYPEELIYLSNTRGEMKSYNPKKNETLINFDIMYSTKNDIIYQFFTKKTTDMGLKENGYKLINTKKDKSYLITEWQPPEDIQNVQKVLLVQENMLPVYFEVYNNDKIIKKTYLDNYYVNNNFFFPQRVIEIEYLKNNDSIITRKIYSDILIDSKANSEFFNYKIPQNAKVISIK